MNTTKHTPGPLTISGQDIFGTGVNSYVCTWSGWRDSARLLRAAYTSYDKHCGERAVECAEDDLLGNLLIACKEAAELYDLLSLSTLEAAAKYGPDYEPPTAVYCLHIRRLLEAVIAKAEPEPVPVADDRREKTDV